MKKIIFTLLSLIPLSIFGQISVTKTADEKIERIIKYDSLNNFLGEEFLNYIGQELFLNPKAEVLRKYGYDDFKIDPEGKSYGSSNVYKKDDSSESNYDELQNKVFEVLDVQDDPTSSFSDYAFLKLKFKDSDEIVYYRYSKKYRHSFPFTVMGYYNKMKQLFVQNDVLIRDFKNSSAQNRIDIDTGEILDIVTDKYYECIDITMNDKTYSLSLKLKTQQGNKFLFALSNRMNNIPRILLKEEAEKYKKKFGDVFWDAILREVIKVGFTEEMTLLSWGKPKSINSSTSSDQWVYSGQYVYFKNGILESWN